MDDEFLIAWCRCGPRRIMLERVLTLRDGARIWWRGGREWVEPSAINDLHVGSSAWLGEADLCHRPGRVRLLREATVIEIRRLQDRLAIALRCGGKGPVTPDGPMLPVGRLVGAIRDDAYLKFPEVRG
jgi:hypothetical protein